MRIITVPLTGSLSGLNKLIRGAVMDTGECVLKLLRASPSAHPAARLGGAVLASASHLPAVPFPGGVTRTWPHLQSPHLLTGSNSNAMKSWGAQGTTQGRTEPCLAPGELRGKPGCSRGVTPRVRRCDCGGTCPFAGRSSRSGAFTWAAGLKAAYAWPQTRKTGLSWVRSVSRCPQNPTPRNLFIRPRVEFLSCLLNICWP